MREEAFTLTFLLTLYFSLSHTKIHTLPCYLGGGEQPPDPGGIGGEGHDERGGIPEADQGALQQVRVKERYQDMVWREREFVKKVNF